MSALTLTCVVVNKFVWKDLPTTTSKNICELLRMEGGQHEEFVLGWDSHSTSFSCNSNWFKEQACDQRLESFPRRKKIFFPTWVARLGLCKLEAAITFFLGVIEEALLW